MSDEEEYGGDPPCWAHLFDSEGMDGEDPLVTACGLDGDDAGIVELAAIARMATARGAVWTRQTEDLDVNLLVFPAGEGVAEHVNTEVDVLLVGITGSGVITVDGASRVLHAGHALVVPKGANRGIRSSSHPFAYLSCHCRRGGLWPGG